MNGDDTYAMICIYRGEMKCREEEKESGSESESERKRRFEIRDLHGA